MSTDTLRGPQRGLPLWLLRALFAALFGYGIYTTGLLLGQISG